MNTIQKNTTNSLMTRTTSRLRQSIQTSVYSADGILYKIMVVIYHS